MLNDLIPCSVDGCYKARRYVGSGLCGMHNRRLQVHGSLNLPPPRPRFRRPPAPKLPCSVEGCSKPILARGWCGTHYARWHSRGGDPSLLRRINDPVVRLEEYGRQVGECIVWTRACDPNGYGTTAFGGRVQKVHRVQWMLRQGPIPPGMEVCHTCDNRPCFRIEHLFLGTHLQNMQDMAAKGRGSGLPRDLQPGARFTTAEVAEVVAFYNTGQHSLQSLATHYNVGKSTIYRLIKQSKSANLQVL